MQPTELVNAAKGYLKEHFKPCVHHVACALIVNSEVFYGLHLDVSSGFDVCAEPIAISKAISTTGNTVLKDGAIVAVAWDGQENVEPWVVSPCGNCRQILSEYTSHFTVLIDKNDNLTSVPVGKLLPYPYVTVRQNANNTPSVAT